MMKFTLPRWLVGLLALCFCVTITHADPYQIATITVTNAPTTNGQHLIWNGTRRNFTNTLGAATAILTNTTTGGSTTNLYNSLISYRESTIQFLSITNGTNLVLRGYPNAVFAITIGSNWGSYTITTNQSTNSQFVQVPLSVFGVNVRTGVSSALVYDLGVYPSNALPANARMMTNFVGITNAQTLTQKTLTAPAINGGTNDGAVLTNVLRANLALMIATNATLLSGTASNMTFSNIVWLNGYLGGLTNGRIVNAFITNAPSVQATNLNAYGGTLSNFIAHTLTVTNLSSPGTGTDSQKIGNNSSAIGNYTIAYGVSSSASNLASVALGYGALTMGESGITIGTDTRVYGFGGIAIGIEAGASKYGGISIGALSYSDYSNSVAIGTAANTTATNQIRLGTSSEHVSIPGELRDSKQTNVWFTGTNRFDLAVSFTATNITTLANGVNLVDPGMKTYLRVSGPTAAYSLDKLQRGWDGRVITIQKTDSYTLTINNESGSAGGAATDRILTGTGATATITNNPGFCVLQYDATAGRWGVVSKSN